MLMGANRSLTIGLDTTNNGSWGATTVRLVVNILWPFNKLT